MADLTIYEKPTCTTCKNLALLLRERGIAFDAIDYHVAGLREDELRGLIAKTGGGPRALLRAREVKAIGLDADALDDEALIAAMVEHPALLERPVVVRGDRAVLARPIDRVLEILD